MRWDSERSPILLAGVWGAGEIHRPRAPHPTREDPLAWAVRSATARPGIRLIEPGASQILISARRRAVQCACTDLSRVTISGNGGPEKFRESTNIQLGYR